MLLAKKGKGCVSPRVNIGGSCHFALGTCDWPIYFHLDALEAQPVLPSLAIRGPDGATEWDELLSG